MLFVYHLNLLLHSFLGNKTLGVIKHFVNVRFIKIINNNLKLFSQGVLFVEKKDLSYAIQRYLSNITGQLIITIKF